MIRKFQVLKGVANLLKSTKRKSDSAAHRFLGIDEAGVVAAVIDLSTKRKHGNVELIRLSELEQALQLNKVTTVTVTAQPANTDGTIRFQERAWKVLKPFHESPNNLYLFDRNERASLITTAATKGGVSEVTVRMMLRRFLQGGCTKTGLRCEYVRCGTPANGIRALGPNMGRPSALSDLKDKLGKCQITPEIAEKFVKGIKTHLIGVRNRNISKSKAFRRILFDHFRHEVQTEDGKPELIFEEQLPTYDQFRYFVRKFFSSVKIAKSRKTAVGHGTSGRSKTSETGTLKPRGPGDIFIIDSTPADLNLVSSSVGEGRRVIGRPRVYYVIDAWSQMIVGFHVTLGEASYEEAILCVLSILEDKKELCRNLGIPYRASDWPTTGLAGTIIADRQEFIYKDSDLLHDRLGIHLTNTPAYCGDYKGLIEASLGYSMRELWSLPGAADPKRGKDETSTFENAIYNFHESKRIILAEVIRLNRRFLKNLSIPRQFIDMDCGKVPSRLYAKGSEKLSGFGLAADIEYVRTALLPYVTTASTNREGIRVSAAGVHNIIYRDVEGNLPSELFELGGGKQLKVQYDSRTMDVVFVEHPTTGQVFPCFLSERRREDYKGLSWAQGKDYQARLKELEQKTEKENLPIEAAAYDTHKEMNHTAIARALAEGVVPRNHVKKHLKILRAEERTSELNARSSIEVLPPPTLEEDYF